MADDTVPKALVPPRSLTPQDRRASAVRATFRTLGRIAPGATARLAEAMLVRTQRPAPRHEEVAFLGSADRFTVRAAGETIAGYRWGDPGAPAVLFAHGWWSHAGRFTPLAQALLGSGFRGVAYDAPGHGRSSGWRASMPEFAATLRAIADHEGAMHAVVGHSLGGAAAVFAMARGLVVERAVTIAAPSDINAWAYRFRDTFAIPPAAFRRMQANLERRLRVTWAELDTAALARALDAPGLVIHDVHDPDVPWTDGQAIAAGWRSAELVTTEGLGHRAILRDDAVIRRT